MRRRKLAVFRVGKVILQGAVGTEGANKVNGEELGYNRDVDVTLGRGNSMINVLLFNTE